MGLESGFPLPLCNHLSIPCLVGEIIIAGSPSASDALDMCVSVIDLLENLARAGLETVVLPLGGQLHGGFDCCGGGSDSLASLVFHIDTAFHGLGSFLEL